MTDTYQQPPAERCVKSMKKSGKLAIALAGVILGVLLLFFGNRAGKDTPDPTPNTPPETSVPSAEAYRAELETRVKALCSRVCYSEHYEHEPIYLHHRNYLGIEI